MPYVNCGDTKNKTFPENKVYFGVKTNYTRFYFRGNTLYYSFLILVSKWVKKNNSGNGIVFFSVCQLNKASSEKKKKSQ